LKLVLLDALFARSWSLLSGKMRLAAKEEEEEEEGAEA